MFGGGVSGSNTIGGADDFLRPGLAGSCCNAGADSACIPPTDTARFGGVAGGFFTDFGLGAGGGGVFAGVSPVRFTGAFGVIGDRFIVPGGDGLEEKLDREPIEDLRREFVGLEVALVSMLCCFFQKSLDLEEVTSSSSSPFEKVGDKAEVEVTGVGGMMFIA